MKKEYDLIIIGGGPAGMWGAYYAAHRGLSVCLIERNDSLGGLPRFNYPSKPIYDIPGILDVTGSKLIDRLKKQIETKNEFIDIFTDTSITTILKKDDFVVQFTQNEQQFKVKAKTLLFSQGVGEMQPRHLDIDTSNVKVNYTINSFMEFKNKDTIISGGGDSALENALWLARENPNNTISLCHRRNEFRGKESILNEIKECPNLNLYTPFVISNISGKDKVSVTLQDVDTKSEKQIVVRKILVQHGYVIQRNSKFFENLNIQKVSKTSPKYLTNDEFESTEEKAFIVGVSSSAMKQNLIISSFGATTIAICCMVQKYFDNRTRNF